MKTPSILYTCRIDLSSPISTIHRKVGQRLPEYRTVSLGNHPGTGIDRTFTFPEPMRISDLPRLFRAYANEYDIIHTGPRNRDYLAWLTTIRGAKHVHTLHAAPNEPKVIKRERRLASHADHVTAVSPYVKQWAFDTLDIDEPITVIPNGVDMDIFEPVASPAEQTFVFVGRLIERKHPQLVLRLARKWPEAAFKIRGSGPLESEIVDTAQSLENVEVIPKLSRQKLADLYANATAILCPYEREGFGMVVIESMASGTPVIGLDSGNLSSLITPESGVLCSTLDIEEWNQAMLQVSNSTEIYDSRLRAEKYAWSRIAKLYEDVYETVDHT